MTQFNTFNPLQASTSVMGRSFSGSFVPTAFGQNFSTLLRNRAYARLDSAFIINRTNPNFDAGAAGRIIASLTDPGNDPRIVRGYIRRSSVDNADPTSSYRLYFMFNPEMIQRQYVSYLDQQALDPFNTIFNAGNLVAPPSILDFNFSMFFDRQVENANGSMPRGALEDFDYFDLVVRGVVPDPQSPELPDNGIMMINPRNITVVFSPQLSVQGRANIASVYYEKFDHRMRPTRLTITVGMKAYYIGPVRPDFTFAQSKEQGVAAATIPYENTVVEVYEEQVTPTSFYKGTKGTDFPSNAIGAHAVGGKTTGVTGKYPINSPFGVPRGDHNHGGIDFGTKIGVPIIAPVPLVIAHAGGEGSALNMGGFGISVAGVTVPFGDLILMYGHLSSVACNVGDGVEPGRILGYTGNTGHSTGPHLHFEIRQPGSESGKPIDPSPYLASGWQVLGE